MSTRFRHYSYFVGGVFWLALLARLVLGGGHEVSAARLAPLVALAVVGEELVIRGERDGTGSTLSLSAVAHVAAALVLTPAGAALAAALGVLVGDGFRRDGRHYLLINSAMFGGSAWIAAEAFRAVEGSHVRWTLGLIPALLVLISVRYVVSSVLYSLGLAALGNRGLLRLIARTTLEEMPAAVGEGSLGVLLAFSVDANAVLLPFLLPPLVALFLARANYERLRRETERALQAMADVIDARDPSTSAHSERVAELVERFASALDLPRREAERLVAAARFHDLGKIAVDTRTLASSERLSPDEIRQIRMHPRLSAQLLRPFSFAREIAEYAALHHERWDGAGYYGVAGDRVPIEAHVLVVADSFDAMTSSRPYRPAVTTEDAVVELLDKAGTQFHPLVARAFAALLSEQPLSARLGRDEIRVLRRSFARVKSLTVPSLRRVDLRLAAVSALAATLVVVGIPRTPEVLIAAMATVSAAALAGWAALLLRLRSRRRRAADALTAGESASTVLAACGLSGWIAELHANDEAPLDPDVREAQSWLRLDPGQRHRRLASGADVVVARSGDERWIVAGLQRPHRHELDLAEWLVDELALRRAPVIAAARAEPCGSEKVVARVDLRAFERLRRGAGQLLAERIVDEAEARLRMALRSSDAIVRTDDDVFSISLSTDSVSPETIEERLATALRGISLPQRLGVLEPDVVVAPAAKLPA